MELIYLPASRRKRCPADNGDTAVATISVIRNVCGCSRCRDDQGSRRQVP